MSQYYKKPNSTVLSQFKLIVGKENYFDNIETRWSYAFGGINFQKKWIPDLVLITITTEQIRKILKIANKEKIPVTPRGMGTSLSGGQLTPYAGIVLDLSRMNRIIKIDIINNYVELEPGVICDDLNNILKTHGYFFPPDPGSSSVATIGGMVASNAGGIQAFKYGVTKQYVLFLEVVLSNGEILNLGSEVLKSVETYNIKDLFIGSEGSLGIITKIGLKIRPLPSFRKLGLFIFNKIENIQNVAVKIRKKGIIPNILEFMDKFILKAIINYLKGDFLNFPKGYVLIIELDGENNKVINEEFEEIKKIIDINTPIFTKIAKDDTERENLILARKSSLPALSKISPTCCVEDCSIKISDFAEIIKKIENIPEKINAKNLKVAISSHMEGNLHPKFMFNENNPDDLEEFKHAMEYLYLKVIIPSGGSITGEHGIGKVKGEFLNIKLKNNIIKLMEKIKRIFDPTQILNPGIGKGDKRKLILRRDARILKNYKGAILKLNCMRCGFCVKHCPSWILHNTETYSPRGRLSILNGLVYGDLELNNNIYDIFHSCTLCGLCVEKCPSKVDTLSIFEKLREILHS